MMKEFVYEQSGVVEKGMELGKPIGFPTANIHFDQPNISGTYAGLVWVGEREYRAAVYANQGRQLLEAHLFGFSGDLYGEEIRITLLAKVAEAAEFTLETDAREFITQVVQKVKDYFQI
ncbi:MAG: riboflavin kinase [Candidatus Moraniibacteriota bacterium]